MAPATGIPRKPLRILLAALNGLYVVWHKGVAPVAESAPSRSPEIRHPTTTPIAVRNTSDVREITAKFCPRRPSDMESYKAMPIRDIRQLGPLLLGLFSLYRLSSVMRQSVGDMTYAAIKVATETNTNDEPFVLLPRRRRLQLGRLIRQIVRETIGAVLRQQGIRDQTKVTGLHTV